MLGMLQLPGIYAMFAPLYSSNPKNLGLWQTTMASMNFSALATMLLWAELGKWAKEAQASKLQHVTPLMMASYGQGSGSSSSSSSSSVTTVQEEEAQTEGEMLLVALGPLVHDASSA